MNTPKYHALADGEMAAGKYKYTCRECGKPYLDSVYKQTDKICNRCAGLSTSNLPIIRGAKRHHAGIHSGRPGPAPR